MMKVSKLTDYAVMILITLSQISEERVSASTLSQRSCLAEPTVSKILKLLAKQGVVKSVRGVSGGYYLQKPLEQISIVDVIKSIDGPIAVTACVDESVDKCCLQHSCAMQSSWKDVNIAINSALDKVKLSDMVPTPMFMNEISTQKIKKKA